jgi:hypothetical protein
VSYSPSCIRDPTLVCAFSGIVSSPTHRLSNSFQPCSVSRTVPEAFRPSQLRSGGQMSSSCTHPRIHRAAAIPMSQICHRPTRLNLREGHLRGSTPSTRPSSCALTRSWCQIATWKGARRTVSVASVAPCEQQCTAIDVVNQLELCAVRKAAETDDSDLLAMLQRVGRPVRVDRDHASGCDPEVSRMIFKAHLASIPDSDHVRSRLSLSIPRSRTSCP